MSEAWDSGSRVVHGPIGLGAILRLALRLPPMALLVFGGLAIMLVVRLVERPIFGLLRPWTQKITVFVCRNSLRIAGLQLERSGQPMDHMGIVVANHSSWLDIFALNASQRVYFVSKSEVASWPGIGWLARATGTVFIDRDRKQAQAHRTLIQERLVAGHRLLFFPEGTSTDGRRVLPFKPTLFAALFAPEIADKLWVQPVTVHYRAPVGEDPRFYGWWGDMDFGPHFLWTLAASKLGRVHITYHAPLDVSAFADRKALARACEEVTRGCLDARLSAEELSDP